MQSYKIHWGACYYLTSFSEKGRRNVWGLQESDRRGMKEAQRDQEIVSGKLKNAIITIMGLGRLYGQ